MGYWILNIWLFWQHLSSLSALVFISAGTLLFDPLDNASSITADAATLRKVGLRELEAASLKQTLLRSLKQCSAFRHEKRESEH